MRSKELADLAGVTVRALRHYHQLGLLPEPPRAKNGYREYGAVDLARVLRIKRLSSLGISLQQVAEMLAEEQDSAGRGAADTRRMMRLPTSTASLLRKSSTFNGSAALSPNYANGPSTPMFRPCSASTLPDCEARARAVVLWTMSGRVFCWSTGFSTSHRKRPRPFLSFSSLWERRGRSRRTSNSTSVC